MSTTYPVPGQEGDYPAPRHSDLELRVVPNEGTIRQADAHLGELVQLLYDSARDEGLSIELDTSDRTRPGEMRGGADPGLVLLAIVLGQAVADYVVSKILDAAVEWVRGHLRPVEDHKPTVTIYGADGNVLREVEVEAE
jgi:hypothetical protein